MEIVVKSQKNSGTNKSHVRKTIFVVEDDQDLFSLIQKEITARRPPNGRRLDRL